ncbi:MAG: T9SS type A sorting domain-containing protein, partial [Flavobacteriales bacterium]|nr:T9SS type A sorting domain-containing protein [Flavobacteriales bacterium]
RIQFAPYAVDIQVEFRLAHLDPNGDCTEGIVRIESPLAENADDAVKSVSYWDSKKYFNIWTVISMDGDNPPSIILGYAQFPTSGINNTYGVVMRYSYVSRSDRTLSHEVGHCFGLYHTFQGGCGGSCSTSGDRCCDTPPVDISTQGCNTNQNTCNTDANGPDPWGGNDMEDLIENFMSYDACQNMFSLDQKSRMYTYLNSTSTNTGLNQLTTAGNLAFTGTANPYGTVICTPIAEFSYDKEFICEGSTVTFTDDSYNATPTGWNWTFNGGTPSVSSVVNPTITYNTAGVYSVTHQPFTTAGSGISTKTSIITVSSITADYVGPITDGFENTTQFNGDWIINSGSDVYDWENTTTASATGTRSIMIDNYSTSSSATDVDYIVSPSYDLSTSSNKAVKFKIAFANRVSGNTDRLMCYYSINCGATWLLKLPITNGNLVTAPDHSNSFVPTASEWVEKTMDFTSIGSSTNVRFKFQFESGGGNNIYLDDINIGGLVGIADYGNIGSFNVYPNPTNAGAQISFNLTKGINNLSIKVRNAIGQEVTSVINGKSFVAGKYTLKIDEGRKLSPGVYFIEFNADNNIKIQKLIVQ